MRLIKLVLCLACVAGIASAELPRLNPVGVDGVMMPTLSARAGMVGSNVPAFVALSATKPLSGDVGEWREISSLALGVGMEELSVFPVMGANVEALEVSELPVAERWNAWSPWVSIREVNVQALELEAVGVSTGVRTVNPMREARSTFVGWDLVPFQVGRHSAMGELRVAANAAEARGDTAEAERLRREFWRIGGIMAARREAFAARPAPTRGGAGDGE
ncbi:MAG: hypothetical protein JJU29_18465 [Verrucomicrobia bacterium]|nr:hypothetical protein [Verrucomicrobiota bacterium]MCH8512331.1 hypothetical protein [Kiritimatiellia bacterium]